MTTYHLRTPLSEDDVRVLHINDVVYLSGEVVTARDEAHHRALAYYRDGKALPIDVAGKAIYHCGPLVTSVAGQYRVVSAGPTTSMRLERFEAEFLERFRVRMVIGKGGMGARTTEAMQRFGAVYCAFTGGAGALAGQAVRGVKSVEWLDLGMPEALWTLDVADFGPLIVAIDTHGQNLHADVMKAVAAKRQQIYRQMGFADPAVR